MDHDQPPHFGPVARLFIRAAQAVVVANVRLRGGVPEAATCADVRQSNRKLREVAKAGGWRDVEPLVREACATAEPDERAYSLTLRPLTSELFRR